MTDLETKLRSLTRNHPPELWDEIRRRAVGPAPTSAPLQPRRRWPTIVVALVIAVLAVAFAVAALRPSHDYFGPAGGGTARPILFDARRTVSNGPIAEQVSAIWSVNPDGSDPQVLYDDPDTWDEQAVWSPDGTRIAFTSYDANGTGGLIVMNPDGSGVLPVTHDFDVADPAWFPDSRSIVFTGGPEGPDGSSVPSAIWRVDVRTGDLTKLIDDPNLFAPSISPDGARLVATGFTHPRAQTNTSELFIANADGSGLHQFTSDGGFYRAATWSPTADELATSWAVPGDGGSSDIYLVAPDGSPRHRITDFAGWDAGPMWSPDGSRIAFESDRDATPAELANTERTGSGPSQESIFVMKADGSDIHRIVAGADYATPTSWGP